MLSDVTAQGKAVLARQHDVQNDQAEGAPRQKLTHGFAITHSFHIELEPPQICGQRTSYVLVIINDQDARTRNHDWHAQEMRIVNDNLCSKNLSSSERRAHALLCDGEYIAVSGVVDFLQHHGIVASRLHTQGRRGRLAQINDAPLYERAAIIDANHDFLAVAGVLHQHARTEWQRLVGGGELFHVKAFTVRSFSAVKARAVPRSNAAAEGTPQLEPGCARFLSIGVAGVLLGKRLGTAVDP